MVPLLYMLFIPIIIVIIIPSRFAYLPIDGSNDNKTEEVAKLAGKDLAEIPSILHLSSCIQKQLDSEGQPNTPITH